MQYRKAPIPYNRHYLPTNKAVGGGVSSHCCVQVVVISLILTEMHW